MRSDVLSCNGHAGPCMGPLVFCFRITLPYWRVASCCGPVCQTASFLREAGVRKGDAVCVYMPMVPELPIAMLACARIGAVHSVSTASCSPARVPAPTLVPLALCTRLWTRKSVHGVERVERVLYSLEGSEKTHTPIPYVPGPLCAVAASVRAPHLLQKSLPCRCRRYAAGVPGRRRWCLGGSRRSRWSGAWETARRRCCSRAVRCGGGRR